jgi:NADH-quinone oxidoreductase subunit M
MDSLFRVLVLLLVLLPLGSAAVVPLLGRAARRAALILALVHVGLTAAVALGAREAAVARAEQSPTGPIRVARFEPNFVPGDPGIRGNTDAASHRTVWTLLRLGGTTPPAAGGGPAVQFFLGIDGLNLWLVALCSVMLVVAILVSWDAVTDRPGPYYGWLFVLQAGAIGAFLSFDVILFYVFFELTLIPAFFLIGRWGTGSARRDAARKFFLYTLAGSLLTLVGVVGVVLTNPTPVHPKSGAAVSTGVVVVPTPDASVPGGNRLDFELAKRGPITFSLPDLMGNVQIWADTRLLARAQVAVAEEYLAAVKANPNASPAAVREAERQLTSARRVVVAAEERRSADGDVQFWLFIALIAGFMVKVPVWPFHTWLPSAYGEAPLGVTILLSALLAKLGTFGILRFVLTLTPDAALAYGLPAIGTLAAVGIVYGALCAFAQRDMKLLVAYSSLSHLGFLVLGLFAFNQTGLSGAVLHMVNHGVSTGALFALLGFFLARYGTTDVRLYGGLMGRFPRFALLTFVLCLASIGLPGLNNFVSEMLMLGGLFDARNPHVHRLGLAVVAAVSILLSAWYVLTMLQRVFFNPLREPPPVVPGEPPKDLTNRELVTLGLLAALCLLLGLFPQVLLDTIKPDTGVLSTIGDAARMRAGD